MKTIKSYWTSLVLVTVAGCALLAPTGPTELETEGALGRQVERVVERHDAYVMADIDPPAEATEQSATVRGLMQMPTVRAVTLRGALEPVMARHDAYVTLDGTLDELERDSYLGTTRGLRSLLDVK